MMYFNIDYSEKDAAVLAWQLKNNNIFAKSVLSRCPWGYPKVVLLSPLPQKNEKKGDKLNFIAISTPLWLTCPFLNDKIHKLEDQGYVKKIEGVIQGETGYLEEMKQAHVHYAFLRKKSYLQFIGEQETIEPNCKLMSSGVGGIRTFDTVKCLHLHYAHFTLYQENSVGRITSIILENDTHCREENCRNAVLKESNNSY